MGNQLYQSLIQYIKDAELEVTAHFILFAFWLDQHANLPVVKNEMVILKLLIPSIFKFEKGELSGATLGIHSTYISDSSLITCPNQLSDLIHDVRR